MCSELTSRTRAWLLQSDQTVSLPVLTLIWLDAGVRPQTWYLKHIIPAWAACFLLFVQLKACSPWLKGTDDALALPNRWGHVATWPWETREKQTCVSLASLSMLSLIHCCCIFLQCALGCLISTFITQCPHMQQLFPWLINHLTHIESAKSCIFWSSYFWILTIYQLLLFTVCTAVCTGHIL